MRGLCRSCGMDDEDVLPDGDTDNPRKEFLKSAGKQNHGNVDNYSSPLKSTRVVKKVMRTQTGSDILFEHIIHCGQQCQEFVVASPGFRLKSWILMTVIFNIVGFLLELHTQDSRVMTGLIVSLLLLLVLKLHFRVKQESLLVIGSLGVQLTTTFASGRSTDTFYDISEVGGIVINEGITMHRVIFYLTLMLHDDRNSKSITKLLPLFQQTWPSLACLVCIHQGAQAVLHRAAPAR